MFCVLNRTGQPAYPPAVPASEYVVGNQVGLPVIEFIYTLHVTGVTSVGEPSSRTVGTRLGVGVQYGASSMLEPRQGTHDYRAQKVTN